MRVAFANMASNTGFKLAWRARDPLENFRGRGLLLQRFGKLPRAGLHLVEQPHVLNGNSGLVSECCRQLDLFFGEWMNSGTNHCEYADRNSFAHHWDARQRPVPAEADGLGHCIIGILKNIYDLNRCSRCDRSTDDTSTIELDLHIFHVVLKFKRISAESNMPIICPILSRDRRHLGFAKTRCRLYQCV